MSEIASLKLDANYLGREGRPYQPDEGLIHAANTALALGRPLLLTGEPGVGKTEFAFAAARALSAQAWPAQMGPDEHRKFGLLECYVRSDTTAQDLLYTYDAVGRFGDAYLREPRVQNPAHYLELRGLGLALASSQQRVVLIDEMDKAPRDLPNDLLRELDQGTFEIAELEDQHAAEAVVDRNGIPLRRRLGEAHRPVDRRPFVIITTNEERPLPSAFLRRCIYHHVPFPTPQELTIIVDAHVDAMRRERKGAPPAPTRPQIEKAVAAFLSLRNQSGMVRKPSTSELLEWVSALLFLGTDDQHGRPGPESLERAAERVPKNPGRETWQSLPRLMCLVKTREDRRELGLDEELQRGT